MAKIKIVIDNELHIPNLSTEWIEGLAKLVSYENEEKKIAQKELIWGANKMDDFITLADYNGGKDELILPRGFLSELQEIFKEAGHEQRFYDDMEWSLTTEKFNSREPEYKKEQRTALISMKCQTQGRVIAPPGMGKTVVGLGSICEHGRPALILVGQKHIAQQWQDRAQEHFGFDIGFIGDNKWNEKKVSVALVQTLWSRRDKLTEKDWWDKWSMVILDEQHHIPAETYTAVISKFKAMKRFGLSATVGKSESKKRISELMFGKIIYETDSQEIKPEVVIIDTNFDFDFYPTRKFKKNGKTKIIRNNYQKLIKELIYDEDRNLLIAKNICREPNNAHLIISRRLDHLYGIRNFCIEMGFPEDRALLLTGKEDLNRRMEIYEESDNGNVAIFSTVASEALDIPRLDRLHKVYPTKNEEIIKQEIGRIVRPHLEKQSAIVYDYLDICTVLVSQYKHRLRKLYQPQKIKVRKQ